ncbi:MAG: adenosylmethionine--8-amino-7-oxononanoate transaminase [Flavobacteriales bacterium]|nr:adenosylmethionine--8-amino-7-oxononanoate transaminase [Flavobacteriales bacterium]
MSITEKDKKYIWHPFTQMKEAVQIPIVKGSGVWLFAEDEKKYIDAVSSWWVNIHGHSHPYIAEKVYQQFLELEHVLFSGFTTPVATELAERLILKMPWQQKVFFSDNGSTAVEVAVKMAIQYFKNKKEERNTIVVFKNAYHGDTFGAMSLSQKNIFNEAFSDFVFDVKTISAPEYGCETHSINELKNIIENEKVIALLYEPMIQGAGGMRIQNPLALNNVLELAKSKNILLIADEVMTGFYRTGRMFASEYTTVKPDLMALSKALTGGVMPLGLTTCTDTIYNEFLGSTIEKTFYHGHSFTGNPLACAAACASLELLEKQKTKEQIVSICERQQEAAHLFSVYNKVKKSRSLGTILALELDAEQGYFSNIREEMYSFFLQKGIVLRPLGNVLYFMPPYCINTNEMNLVYEAIHEFLKAYQPKE